MIVRDSIVLVFILAVVSRKLVRQGQGTRSLGLMRQKNGGL